MNYEIDEQIDKIIKELHLRNSSNIIEQKENAYKLHNYLVENYDKVENNTINSTFKNILNKLGMSSEIIVVNDKNNENDIHTANIVLFGDKYYIYDAIADINLNEDIKSKVKDASTVIINTGLGTNKYKYELNSLINLEGIPDNISTIGIYETDDKLKTEESHKEIEEEHINSPKIEQVNIDGKELEVEVYSGLNNKELIEVDLNEDDYLVNNKSEILECSEIVNDMINNYTNGEEKNKVSVFFSDNSYKKITVLADDDEYSGSIISVIGNYYNNITVLKEIDKLLLDSLIKIAELDKDNSTISSYIEKRKEIPEEELIDRTFEITKLEVPDEIENDVIEEIQPQKKDTFNEIVDDKTFSTIFTELTKKDQIESTEGTDNQIIPSEENKVKIESTEEVYSKSISIEEDKIKTERTEGTDNQIIPSEENKTKIESTEEVDSTSTQSNKEDTYDESIQDIPNKKKSLLNGIKDALIGIFYEPVEEEKGNVLTKK